MQRDRASTVHSTQKSTLLPAPTSHLPKGKRKAISFFFSSAALWLESPNSPVGLPAVQGISCIRHHRKALPMQWLLLMQAPTPTTAAVLPHTPNQAAKCPQWACDASRKHKPQVILQDLQEHGPAGDLWDTLGWSSCSPGLWLEGGLELPALAHLWAVGNIQSTSLPVNLGKTPIVVSPSLVLTHVLGP